jgi:protocatechuate 3,4-dioxygenase beta subunit
MVDRQLLTPNAVPRITRRYALTVLGGATGAALLSGCSGGGGSGSGGSASIAGTATATASSSLCEATPEGEIGPYFVDDSAAGFERSDIRSNLDGGATQNGIPLTLAITVIDTEAGCIGLEGVQVDIWHCNAEGVYSDEASEGTPSDNWLRGYQVTDSAGEVAFTTIFPGWYQGRATHIHLRLRSKYSTASSTRDGTNTTQLFFPQAIVDTINTTIAPYASHAANSTTNETDHVNNSETNGETVLTLNGSTTSGLSAAVTIGLPITAI